MKKINLVLVGAPVTACYGKPQGSNNTPRPFAVTSPNSQAIEKLSVLPTKLLILDYLYGTSKPVLMEVTSGTFSLINPNFTASSIKRDSLDYVCDVVINEDNLLLAISSGTDADAGTTLLYVKGRSLNNSKPYLVYEIASTFNEFLAL